jgi:lactoylglutathione lyase
VPIFGLPAGRGTWLDRDIMSAVRMSHVALAVSDLETSLRFYIEGLGFEPGQVHEADDDIAPLCELPPPVKMTSQYLTKDGFRLELMSYAQPGVHGTPATTRNQRGLTHLSFEVDDVAETEARLLALGGRELPEARTKLERGPFQITIVFLGDPDGIRIELMEKRG